ncbi:unnamed protein product [Ectocarpus sp. 12 AP-2014]
METVPSNSIVAVLPMSVLLLPARTLDSSGPASTDTEHGHSDVDSAARSEGAAIDIFVAYERLKSSSPVFPSPMTLNKTKASSSSPREAKGYFGASVSEGVPNDECKHIRDRSGDGDEIEGLLVTALPSRATSDRQGDCGNGFLRFPQEKDGPRAIPLVGGVDYGKVGSKEIGAAWLGHSRGLQPPPPQSPRSPSPPPPRPRELIGKSLSEMAPIPLLVFDTETFLALGELDERFSFQGGIAEWINRAKFGRGNHDCSCGRSSWRRTGSPKETLAKPSRRTSTELPCSGINVCNVHEQEWGRHFMSSWSEPGERSVDGVHAREFTAEQQVGDELHPSVHPASRGVDHSEAGNQTVVSNCISGDGIQQPTNVADRHACDEVSLDQRNSLHWAKLEALIQADADLFFLRLLLLEQPSDLATVDKVDPARLSIAFHSEWMERAPDTVLAHGVLDRRKRFPVAAVVVVNEDISILRSSLEEVAVVVEHILVVVSTRPWHGDTKIVSATLELMNHMLQDVNSATHGKASPPKNGLHVEVGSWATETEQREYGNLLIREDPRHFFRVVVMDTDEFWHPAELAKALVVIAQHPETMVSRVLVDSYWASVRSVVFPPEERDVVWLVDPYHCVWHAFRNAECSTPVGSKHFFSFNIDRSIGAVHHLSYFEERPFPEQLRLRSISGTLTAVDASDRSGLAVPLWVSDDIAGFTFGIPLVGADAVWSKLLEATPRAQCAHPPCSNGKHMHAAWADLGEEMSRIKGAVVVRRPDLVEAHAMLGPVHTLDFVKAFQSYFAIFRSSLFPTRQMIDEHYLVEVDKDWLFFQAVANGDSEAARFLSTYHATVEVPKPASDGYENIPTLVGMADVFINKLGYVWNDKDYIVPKSCKSHMFGPRASSILPTSAERHEKVFVIAQYWGDEYYHFLVEALPRITLMLDVLVENLDIKVAVHAPKPGSESHTTYIYELLALLGIENERVIFIQTEIHADLAILPSSIPCGRPDTQMVNMLRSVLLKAMYPRTRGIPPQVPRPVIVLVVRESRRWLKNNDQVRRCASVRTCPHI